MTSKSYSLLRLFLHAITKWEHPFLASIITALYNGKGHPIL